MTSYENKFQELKTKLLGGVTLQTGVTVVRMMNVVEHTGRSDIFETAVRRSWMWNIAESVDLNDMPYACGTRFQWEKGCLAGTRESFLREICDVLNNSDEDSP